VSITEVPRWESLDASASGQSSSRPVGITDDTVTGRRGRRRGSLASPGSSSYYWRLRLDAVTNAGGAPDIWIYLGQPWAHYAISAQAAPFAG
jgi:hypothetical protein